MLADAFNPCKYRSMSANKRSKVDDSDNSEEKSDFDLVVTAYPNPTKDNIRVKTEMGEKDPSKFSLQREIPALVVDAISGHVVLSTNISYEKNPDDLKSIRSTPIDMKFIPAGKYVLLTQDVSGRRRFIHVAKE